MAAHRGVLLAGAPLGLRGAPGFGADSPVMGTSGKSAPPCPSLAPRHSRTVRLRYSAKGSCPPGAPVLLCPLHGPPGPDTWVRPLWLLLRHGPWTK